MLALLLALAAFGAEDVAHDGRASVTITLTATVVRPVEAPVDAVAMLAWVQPDGTPVTAPLDLPGLPVVRPAAVARR